MFCRNFLRNGFNFVTQKLQKTKNFPFRMLKHLFLISRLLQNHFLKKLPTANFVLLCQKMISISSLKTSQKTEKCPFQMLTTFASELKVASKPLSTKFFMTKFDLNSFSHLASLSMKMVSTSPIKNLQKTKKNAIFKHPQYWFLS